MKIILRRERERRLPSSTPLMLAGVGVAMLVSPSASIPSVSMTDRIARHQIGEGPAIPIVLAPPKQDFQARPDAALAAAAPKPAQQDANGFARAIAVPPAPAKLLSEPVAGHIAPAPLLDFVEGVVARTDTGFARASRIEAQAAPEGEAATLPPLDFVERAPALPGAVEVTIPAKVNGAFAGKISLWLASAASGPSQEIKVRLGDVLDLVRDNMAPELYERLSGSSSAGEYVNLNRLREAGIPVRFDDKDNLLLGSKRR